METCRALLLVVLTVTPCAGQSVGAGRAGPRPPMDRAAEIALARSAAPASVSAAARVLVFENGRFVVADSGRSGAACLVNRSWPASIEPECFDPEAAATVMPMTMRRLELHHRGVSPDEVSREIAAGLADGTFRLPSRPAVVYMMSAGQRLISDDGRPVGKWKPHLMIYSPYLTDVAVGHHGKPDMSGGLVVDPGQPTSNLLVIVPEFVPAPGADRSAP